MIKILFAFLTFISLSAHASSNLFTMQVDGKTIQAESDFSTDCNWNTMSGFPGKAYLVMLFGNSDNSGHPAVFVRLSLWNSDVTTVPTKVVFNGGSAFGNELSVYDKSSSSYYKPDFEAPGSNCTFTLQQGPAWNVIGTYKCTNMVKSSKGGSGYDDPSVGPAQGTFTCPFSKS